MKSKIMLCKSGKVVWIGDLLIDGEKWCFQNRIESDYAVTLTIADQSLIGKEWLYGTSRESLDERLVLGGPLDTKQIPSLTSPKML